MESRNETEAEMTQSSDSNLKDLDYSCFYSTLRAIFGIPSFANWLKHNGFCEQQTSIICSMADRLHQTGSMSNGKSTESSSSHYVCNKLKHICREHSKHSNDPYAFLTYFLLSMEKSSKKSSNVSECFEKSATSVKETYGSLCTTFKCSTCQHINIADEVLELNLHESCTINDCLIRHFAPERIEQKCRSCNKNMQVKRKLSTIQPPVLCIRGTANGDINIPMQFSQEIDLTKFCSDDLTDSTLQYRLVSMVIQTALGQYSAVLHSADGAYLKCTKFNDQPITHNCMLDVSKFLVFYELKNNNSRVTSTRSFIDPHSTILSTENSFGLNAAFLNYEINETTDNTMNGIMGDEMNDISDDSNTATNEDSCDKPFNNTVANTFSATKSSGYNSGERSDCTKDNKTNETTAQSTMAIPVNESEENVNFDDSKSQSTTVQPAIEADSNTSIIDLLDDSLNGSSPVLKTIQSELNCTNDIGQTSTVVPLTNPQTTAKKGCKKLRETDCTALHLNKKPKRCCYQQFGSNPSLRLDGFEVIELDSITKEYEHAEDPIYVNEQSDLEVIELDSTTEANDYTEQQMNVNEGSDLQVIELDSTTEEYKQAEEQMNVNDGSDLEVSSLGSSTEQNKHGEEQMNVNEGSGYATFQIDSKLEESAISRELQRFGRCIKELTMYPLSSHDIATNVIELVVKYCGTTLKSISLREEKNRTEQGIGFNFEKTFPNLENFECDYVTLVGFRGFFMRHTNLKKIVLKNAKNFNYLLLAIATYCEQLEELEIKISGRLEDDIEDCLQSLKKLRKLTFYYPKKDMTKFTEQLRSLKSLEFLHLYNVNGSPAFVQLLSTLTNLHVLRLTDCQNLRNLNPLANLHQLTELIIAGSDESAELDIINLVNNLKNLEWLDLNKSLDDETLINLRKCNRNLTTIRTRPKIFVFE